MKSTDYWNTYYGEDGTVSAPVVPSQFSTFVLTELNGIDTQIIDFGCGNGRDTLFFARHGYTAIGVDESSMAVEKCKKSNVPNADFLCASVNDTKMTELLTQKLSNNPTKDVTAYARFFLHAIDEASQVNFLTVCRQVIGQTGRAAFEFRTDRDASQTKVTPDHYRRFVKPLDFMAAAEKHGFKVTYFVEGFGYAKFRDDDAHVARFILEPS